MSFTEMAAAVLIVVGIAAGWLTYPWTKAQCYEWAAKQPAEAGVGVAHDLCKRRFGAY